RLGKMFSPDPRALEYPWQTSYAYHRNSPIIIIDFLGGGDSPDNNEVNLQKDGVKAIKLSGAEMKPFTRGALQSLSSAAIGQDRPETTDYSINAQFWGVRFSYYQTPFNTVPI